MKRVLYIVFIALGLSVICIGISQRARSTTTARTDPFSERNDAPEATVEGDDSQPTKEDRYENTSPVARPTLSQVPKDDGPDVNTAIRPPTEPAESKIERNETIANKGNKENQNIPHSNQNISKREFPKMLAEGHTVYYVDIPLTPKQIKAKTSADEALHAKWLKKGYSPVRYNPSIGFKDLRIVVEQRTGGDNENRGILPIQVTVVGTVAHISKIQKQGDFRIEFYDEKDHLLETSGFSVRDIGKEGKRFYIELGVQKSKIANVLLVYTGEK